MKKIRLISNRFEDITETIKLDVVGLSDVKQIPEAMNKSANASMNFADALKSLSTSAPKLNFNINTASLDAAKAKIQAHVDVMQRITANRQIAAAAADKEAASNNKVNKSLERKMDLLKKELAAKGSTGVSTTAPEISVSRDNIRNVSLTDNAFQQLKNTLEVTKNSGSKLKSIFSTLKSELNSTGKSATSLGDRFKGMMNKFKSYAVSFRIITGAIKGIASGLYSLYDSAASYEESLNLYTVSLGEYAEEGTKWATRISDALYLDPSQIMQYAGAFNNLVHGLGVGADDAYKMATNLTQLSYDMSSYLNIDVESAYQKVTSAITGQSRAVVTAGVAMQAASLQELAYSLGIKKSVSAMTQREKTYLRYIQIMRSTQQMQGDLARTIITPENAMRVIQNQFKLLGRSIGQVFIPIVMKAIPYIMVLTQALTALANKLAKWAGFKIADIDYKNLKTADTYLEGIGTTADKTGKKLKNSLAPFDDLNVVQSSSSGSGGGAGGPEIDFSKYLDGYDMLEGYTEKFKKQMDEARKNLEKWIPIIKTIAALWLTWKISKAFMNAITTIGGFIDAWKTIKELKVFGNIGSALGNVISSIPMLGQLGAAFSNVGAGIMEWVTGGATFTEMLGAIGSSLGVIAAAIGGIVAIIAGIARIVTGIKTIIEGDTFKGILQVIEGIALVVAGIALLFGGWIVAAVAAVVAIVAAIVEYWDQISAFFVDMWNGICDAFSAFGDWMYENVIKPVADFFVGLWEGIVDGVTWLWNGIVSILSTVAGWVNDYVIQPILNFFKPIVKWFAELLGSIFQTFKDIFSNIVGFLQGCWELITVIWGIAVEWFKKTIIEPVGKFFSGLWTGIKDAASTAWNFIKGVFKAVSTWFNDNVIKPVAKFFSGMWDGFKEGAKKAWEGVKSVFSTVATFFKNIFTDAWTKVKAVFSVAGKIFEGIKEGIVSAFTTVVNAIIRGINKVVAIPFNAINGALRKVRDISILGVEPFKDKIKEINVPQIPELKAYAQGGFPTTGDLFLANEAGPEFITSIGNKSAVANQDQMVAALSNAIMAGLSQMQTNNQPANTTVYIGNEKVYSGQGTYQNRQSDRYGTTYIKI